MARAARPPGFRRADAWLQCDTEPAQELDDERWRHRPLPTEAMPGSRPEVARPIYVRSVYIIVAPGALQRKRAQAVRVLVSVSSIARNHGTAATVPGPNGSLSGTFPGWAEPIPGLISQRGGALDRVGHPAQHLVQHLAGGREVQAHALLAERPKVAAPIEADLRLSEEEVVGALAG
jgi:hypothetical protein